MIHRLALASLNLPYKARFRQSMVHMRPKASHLAACYKNLISTPLVPAPVHLRVSVTPLKHYSLTSQLKPPAVPSKSRYPLFTSLQSIRHCSHQRSMCRNSADGSGAAMVTKAREVLPTNVKPLHYDLTLEPDFEKFTFEGEVIIE